MRILHCVKFDKRPISNSFFAIGISAIVESKGVSKKGLFFLGFQFLRGCLLGPAGLDVVSVWHLRRVSPNKSPGLSGRHCAD